ncbi:hypothetical protein B0H13DRAFT_1592492, partial [Mycena leptocephala]
GVGGVRVLFSKSNALASTTRHASRFHRQQSITIYLKHTDTFDTYQGEAYLRTLSKEPTEETQEMEYYQNLVNLRDIESRVLNCILSHQVLIKCASVRVPKLFHALKMTLTSI